ncbi:hypothetical protein [Runella sp.]|uniref:hypothetical protein n=1 Tax=Runella sp. TaxID=1960881 RepID=UPI0030179671
MFSEENLKKVLEKAVNDASFEMRRRARAANLLLTGEMIDSFKTGSTEVIKGHFEKQISMAGYVRMKDLRSMHYVRTPPLDSMEYYVKAVGVHSFYYVPGYTEGKRPPSDDAAISRIAWALKMKYKRLPNRKRGYRGIYSEVVRHTLNTLKSNARHEGMRFAIEFVKNTLEGRK